MVGLVLGIIGGGFGVYVFLSHKPSGKTIEDQLKPVNISLEMLYRGIQQLESKRIALDSELKGQLNALFGNGEALRVETSKLRTALSNPNVRGQWGEIHLRRVVELAGMVEHCDFDVQLATSHDDSKIRPDLVVRLPGGGIVVVDSKCPMSSYLLAQESDDPERVNSYLAEHVKHLSQHVYHLSSKEYYEFFDATPDFVVLFLPNEAIFSVALSIKPDLIDSAAQAKVLIATPTTLIALLKAVAYSWRNEELSNKAAQIGELGKEMYERLGSLSGHLAKLGNSLDTAVSEFNTSINVYERRVLATAKKFNEIDPLLKDTKTPKIIESSAHRVSKTDTDL